MPNFFVSTIIRDCERTLPLYINQLDQLESLLYDKYKTKTFVSIYESDSSDGTKALLSDFSSRKDNLFKMINSEVNGFRKFGPVKMDERVINLAWCRNRTVNNILPHMNIGDVFIAIEPDIIYDIVDTFNLINAFISENNDIRSGIILGCRGDGRFWGNLNSVNWSFYDTWALRLDENARSGNIFEDFRENPVKPVWATFSGICVYKAEFFLKGGRFGYHNRRTGEYDCDTTVICENFRALGYNNVVMDQSKVCFHL